ncbi:FtsX-like permease family protein [Streptomyces netropsis]|uniref:Putative ABC transport system permease protein n=1 Tax=Streptomyces netropsis TaxID=55404 RepID=A0A7W7L8T4_STRNE|nr:ABC transporter permease [Streptomyces netropsis]MBB4885670.1 putative ABC transport system permease protein [Streptomyces netropsis]GGR36430.1 ABC transporter [Streptomyces netropsis]
MFRTALRNLLAHKARLMMTALAVLLGTAFVSGTLVFSDSVGSAYRDKTAKNLDDVAVSVTGFGRPGTGPGGDRRVLDDRMVATVRALPGVTSVRPSVGGVATVADKNNDPAGSEWGSSAANYVPGKGGKDSRYPLLKGRGPTAAGEIALDVKTAGKTGAKVGDTVRLAVDGPVMTKKLVGIVETDDPRVSAGGSLALFDTPTAQKLFGKPGEFSELVVSATPGTDQEALTRKVRDVLPKDGFQAQSGKKLAAEQSKLIDEQTSSIRNTFLVFAGISLFVGIFIIANTFTMLIAQRSREIALLRAVGASRRQVVRSVMIEAGLLGLVASAVGFVLGLGIATGLWSVLNSSGASLPEGPLVVEPNAALSALAVGVLVTVLAAWLPSRKAAKIAPVEALSAVDQAPTTRSLVVRNSIGAVLTALGVAVMLYVTTLRDSGGLTAAMTGSALTLAGVIVLAPLLSRPFVNLFGRLAVRVSGVSGKLATQNALRNPRRTAATASALMIGLTLITGLTVAAVSANQGVDKMGAQDLTADYKVTSNSYLGLSPDVAKKLAEQPGVAASVPVRMVGFQSKDVPAGLRATDLSKISKVTDLKITGGSLTEVRGTTTVAVAAGYAKKNGLAVGSALPMEFYDGKKAAPRVVAVYADNDVLAEVLAAPALVDPHLDKVRDDEVLIKAAPGKASSLPAKIKETLGGNPIIKVQSQDDLRRSEAGSIDDILYLMYGLLGMAVVIAVIGVVNTLAMSVFERTREIGMLRAIGLARTGIKQMVRLESVMISMFGAVLGVGVGIFLAWSGGHLLRSSFPQYEMVVPWARIGLFLLLALVVGVLAAVWPARRAAKLNMLESIGAQ